MRLWWRYSVLPAGRRLRERVIIAIAWRLPKSVAYWAFIRLSADANGNPGEQTCAEVLKRHEGWA